MATVRARNMTIENAHKWLGYSPIFDGVFEDWLTLQPLEPSEIEVLDQIREELRTYLRRGRISEGQAKVISLIPLLRLAGYSRSPLEYLVEEDIGEISIEDEDTVIRGRLDLVVANRDLPTGKNTFLWIVVVETKNIEASEFAGIAQLLTYAYRSLERQPSIWGMVTNGVTYQFFYLEKSETGLTYQYLPALRVVERQQALELLQVLKAIAMPYYEVS
jgi:hypothetical protein